jgi:NAD(P)-dependent dehydrogenase (short-subunit alcohol dehydrogenase family)
MDESQKTNKVVAIGGASSGAGRAMALHLGRRGYPVALCARRAGPLEQAAQEIRSAGGRAMAFRADLGEWDQTQAFVEAVVREYGRLDVLINNAGWGIRFAAFETLSLEELQQGVAVNLLSVLYGCRAALPHMKRQGSGHLINVSSIVGKRGRLNLALYCACKHAVEGFSRALRGEVGPLGIKVSILAPGAIRTEWADKAGMPLDPKPRLLSAEDLALMAQYLIETPDHLAIWNMDLMALEQVFNPL